MDSIPLGGFVLLCRPAAGGCLYSLSITPALVTTCWTSHHRNVLMTIMFQEMSLMIKMMKVVMTFWGPL